MQTTYATTRVLNLHCSKQTAHWLRSSGMSELTGATHPFNFIPLAMAGGTNALQKEPLLTTQGALFNGDGEYLGVGKSGKKAG